MHSLNRGFNFDKYTATESDIQRLILHRDCCEKIFETRTGATIFQSVAISYKNLTVSISEQNQVTNDSRSCGFFCDWDL